MCSATKYLILNVSELVRTAGPCAKTWWSQVYKMAMFPLHSNIYAAGLSNSHDNGQSTETLALL